MFDNIFTLTMEKERRRRKSGEKIKNAMVALLVFTMATLEIGFGRKKLLDANGPFGGNVIKNPARYTQTQKIDHPARSTPPTLYEQILARARDLIRGLRFIV